MLRNDEMPDLSSLGHKCMWEQKGGVCFKEKNECPNMLQQKRFLKPCLKKKKLLIKVDSEVSLVVSV